eukprot:RCo005510
MSGLPREILKWLQGLDLSYSVKNYRRDFSNGFLVAEILSRYYKDVPMHAFDNGTSLLKKMDNWQLITKILAKNGLNLSRETVDGVVHQKSGSVIPLLEQLYSHLTKRVVPSAPPLPLPPEVQKPMFAMPTLSTKMREAHPQGEHVAAKLVVDADQDRALNEAVVAEHAQELRQTKLSNPQHFQPKPPREPHRPVSPRGTTAPAANVTFSRSP